MYYCFLVIHNVKLFLNLSFNIDFLSSCSFLPSSPTLRPAGGRSTWTATACDFISHYLTGAMAVMTIKVRTNIWDQIPTKCMAVTVGNNCEIIKCVKIWKLCDHCLLIWKPCLRFYILSTIFLLAFVNCGFMLFYLFIHDYTFSRNLIPYECKGIVKLSLLQSIPVSESCLFFSLRTHLPGQCWCLCSVQTVLVKMSVSLISSLVKDLL